MSGQCFEQTVLAQGHGKRPYESFSVVVGDGCCCARESAGRVK
jgi:hypothetical protein